METGKNTIQVGVAESLALRNWRSLSANNRRLIKRTMEWVASVQEQKDVTFKDYVDPLRPDDFLFTLRASPKDNVFDPAPGDPVGDIGAVVIEYRPSSRPRVGRVLCILPSNKLHPYVIWNDCRHREGTEWITASGTYFETVTEAIEAFGGNDVDWSEIAEQLSALPGRNGTTTIDDESSER